MDPSSHSAVTRDLIVIGTSAGGVQTLQELVRGLPADFPAAVLIVMHTSPSSPAILPKILDRVGALPAKHATDHEPIRPGRIYVAPPDRHLLVKSTGLKVSHGPRENGFRPAVDPLFRTAAQVYGPRVVGVVLSGGLDDGTLGLMRIKEEGGCAVVQDPTEALFPGMPQSAIQNVEVDHVVPVAAMPPLLVELAYRPLTHKELVMARNGTDKPDSAEHGQAALASGKLKHGEASGLICPECGGALWESRNGKLIRYQCHVGHSYTAESLLGQKDGELETSLWSALRSMEETADLRRRVAVRLEKAPFGDMRSRYLSEAAELERRAKVLRDALTDAQAGRGFEGSPPLVEEGNGEGEREGAGGNGAPRRARKTATKRSPRTPTAAAGGGVKGKRGARRTSKSSR